MNEHRDVNKIKEAFGVAETSPLWAGVLKWVLNQGPVTAILAAILSMLWYGSQYALDTAIPLHLKAIQAGYDRQEASHEKSLEKIILADEKSNERWSSELKENRKSVETNINRLIEEIKEIGRGK